MNDFTKVLMERRIAAMFFAMLAGVSAVSSAIVPAIVHV